MITKMEIGTVAMAEEEEPCALQIGPTCVQIPKDPPLERIILVGMIAKPEEKEATDSVGNKVWFHLAFLCH